MLIKCYVVYLTYADNLLDLFSASWLEKAFLELISLGLDFEIYKVENERNISVIKMFSC